MNGKTKLGKVISDQGSIKPEGLVHKKETPRSDATEKRESRVQGLITPTEKKELTKKRGYQSESDLLRSLIKRYLEE